MSRGRVVGTHDGVHRFTVGQRKGLGLSSPIRLYVVGIDAETERGHRRPARGARAHRADGVGGELDCRRSRRRPARAPPRRSAIAIARRAASIDAACDDDRVAGRLRRAAVRRRAGPGGRVLRRGGGRRGRVDRLDDVLRCRSDASCAPESHRTRCVADALTTPTCRRPRSRSAVQSSRVQFRLAEMLRDAFEILLGVDRRHAAEPAAVIACR